jgi:(1->4)-alpha-D-glucan 1-alpha-D-glucosylmutase
LREAKLRTTWTAPNEDYEGACKALLRAWLLEDKDTREELEAAARELDVPGAVIGLSKTVLRMTAPGVPDLYQGTEFWDQSLVDPDNRRPVDYEARRRAVSSIPSIADLLRDFHDGRIKQSVIRQLATLRRSHPRLFLEGGYRPLTVTGEFSGRVIAFARKWAGERCIVVVPRLCSDWLAGRSSPAIPCDRWNDTTLLLDADDAACTFRDVFMEGEKFSGNAIPLRELLDALPVSVLISN